MSVLSENEKMHALNFSLVPWGVASQVALVVKSLPASAGDIRNASSIPGLGRSSGGGVFQNTPVFLPGESHRQRSLAVYNPQGHKESVMTEVT